MPDMLMSDLMAEPMLSLAGGAALGLIALGGAGIAMRRRRRRRENEEFEARQRALASAEAEPVPELDPAATVRPEPEIARVADPIHDRVPDRKAPATKPGGDFGQSRFGRHVQAAYRGPTADNPSVSLEYRLRRAASLDQQEQGPGQQAKSERPADSQARIPARGNWESRSDADFLFRRAGKNAKRPAESS